MKQQKGFTLIELVVVIVILGVLAAVALPRFMNATEDAHTAAVQGTGGALAAGVALVRSQWELNRVKGTANPHLNVIGFGDGTVDVDPVTGWPEGTTDNTTSCTAVWNGVLQGSAPSVDNATTSNPDYLASTGSVTVGSDTQATCIYTYRLDGRTAISTPSSRTIVYNTATGAVTTKAD